MFDAALPVEAVTITEGCFSQFCPGYFKDFFKYSVKTLMRKLLPTPAPPLKNK